MKIILPVAGKGERMRPYTNNLPKCLLPVGGKTIIDWIVGDTRQLARQFSGNMSARLV